MKTRYKVTYEGLAEGYEIRKTTEAPNRYDVFGTWQAAHNKAIKNAKEDIELVKHALKSTKKLTKDDAL